MHKYCITAYKDLIASQAIYEEYKMARNELTKMKSDNNIDCQHKDHSFPEGQFTQMASTLHSVKTETIRGGGGAPFVLRAHVPCRRLNINFEPAIEAIAIEINLRK